MTPPRVTADANLLASRVVRLRTHPDGAPVRVVSAWQAGRFSLILSEHLLSELERILSKPYFAQRIPAVDRAAFLRLLRRHAVIVPIIVEVHGVATHPEDDVVLATALSGDAQFLITGDHKLLRLGSYQDLIVVSAHHFWPRCLVLVQRNGINHDIPLLPAASMPCCSQRVRR